MTDKELLELAAKAAGYRTDTDGLFYEPGEPTMQQWNPLTDDGDALRLAVKLGLIVDFSRPSAGEPFKLLHFAQYDFKDLPSAVRRAIVRAAAEIGKTLKD